jgi:hypothetical protein
MKNMLALVFLAATCGLVAWLWWPLASELLRTGIPADADDHRVSHHVWLTGFIVISAVFISLGIRNIGGNGDRR